jgi:hypothetical protein
VVFHTERWTGAKSPPWVVVATGATTLGEGEVTGEGADVDATVGDATVGDTLGITVGIWVATIAVGLGIGVGAGAVPHAIRPAAMAPQATPYQARLNIRAILLW